MPDWRSPRCWGGGLKAKVAAKDDNLFRFDQTPYFVGKSTSMGTFGYIYIPTACQQGAACRLHVSFHGCHQDTNEIGSEYARDAGYNQWAEANNITVLYPYVEANSLLGNPNACWDWWGYTDRNYAYKTGVQMTSVRAMINSLFVD